MASRGRRESMFSTPQSSSLRGPAAFCWGCLWINQGRGGSPGFSPAPRDCGPTTNPRARGPREPRFLHCTGNMGGRRKVQVPLDLACRMYPRRNPGSLQGWGRRYHNKRTCVLPRVWGAPPALRSRPAEPGLCLSYREGTALGAPLAGGERLTHLKGTDWVSDQTTRFKHRKHEGRKKQRKDYSRPRVCSRPWCRLEMTQATPDFHLTVVS